MPRMDQPVMGAQEIPGEDVAITAIDEPAIEAEIGLTVLAVDGGQMIPRQRRMHMMHDVQVIVEK